MADPIIRAEHIFKTFNAGKTNEVIAVKDVSLNLEKNSCTVLKGPSGSGKSTFLSILSGLARPTSGEYHCLGENVSHWPEKFLTRFRQQHIGIIFQNFNLIDQLTVFWNIAAPLIPHDLSAREIEQKVNDVADQLQISHRLHFNVGTLSGGEMQRVAIARGMVSNPGILIADEPTAHLDSALASEILGLFNALKEQGRTLIISTHDPLIEKFVRVDRTIQMHDGMITNGRRD